MQAAPIAAAPLEQVQVFRPGHTRLVLEEQGVVSVPPEHTRQSLQVLLECDFES